MGTVCAQYSLGSPGFEDHTGSYTDDTRHTIILRGGCYFRYGSRGGLARKGTFQLRTEGVSFMDECGKGFHVEGRVRAKALG